MPNYITRKCSDLFYGLLEGFCFENYVNWEDSFVLGKISTILGLQHGFKVNFLQNVTAALLRKQFPLFTSLS